MTATGTVSFRRHLRADVVPDDAVYLFSERGVTALQGSSIEALAPLLDGTRDLPALLREAARSVPPAQARAVRARLGGGGGGGRGGGGAPGAPPPPAGRERRPGRPGVLGGDRDRRLGRPGHGAAGTAHRGRRRPAG